MPLQPIESKQKKRAENKIKIINKSGLFVERIFDFYRTKNG
jgi:hypothetical protein